jgi:8-oxo-dGTP pyrophosphatase MutT (NUDIX family)
MKIVVDKIAVFVVRPAGGSRTHEFLQLRRAAGEFMGETWQIVRGSIEPGETASAAALRELNEETGLSPFEFFRLGLVETFYLADDQLVHSIPFCAIVKPDAQVTLNAEHTTHRWVPRDAIAGQTIWASERAVLAELMLDILDNGVARPYLRVSLGNPTTKDNPGDAAGRD